MIDISGLVKVKPVHPGRFQFLFGEWYLSVAGWFLSAVITAVICELLVWWSWEGTTTDFHEIAIVILKVVMPLVFGLGFFCELMHFFDHRKRLALYIAGMNEDYRERRMVL